MMAVRGGDSNLTSRGMPSVFEGDRVGRSDDPIDRMINWGTLETV
jgi:hypothetical protein